ncbi:cyanophycinase [Flaviaesturariibacter flavus]|uniref:Cyanophycinase n=1 Tax=Flaviaesturariibacter flavus TaxID=2502780 RepID=A0A4R1BAN5_9BACT|nr:cyanophycinase [Flaviaesturariibacter flavus]TCJ14013.1 cyanophycinase [Flaviaesturariibacter flavus]
MAKEHRSRCPVPRGTLLIIGGAENKGEEQAKKKHTPSDFERFEILKDFRKLLGKKEPRIEVVTTASSEGDELFKDYVKAFGELGMRHVGHIHHDSRKAALDDEAMLDRIRDLDGIFFAGGDQLKYTSIYGGTPFLTLLKERYIYEEIVVAGTSAGAMAMSTPMIYAGNDEVQELGGMIKVTTGLEFLKDVCIDTHFVHRGRVVRMAQVIVTNPGCVGIGIEEDTAIIIRNGIEGQVVGTGTIIVLEGFDITETSIEDFTNEKPLTIRNLKMHILSADDEYRIPRRNPPHV